MFQRSAFPDSSGVPPSLDGLRQRAEREHFYLRRVIGLVLEAFGGLPAIDAHDASVAVARDAFVDLASQLHAHLAREEHLLFPALAALAAADRDGAARPPLPFPTVLNPIRLMEREHERIEATLERIQLALGAPSAIERHSESWQHCVVGIMQLGADLREHQRRENEVLFPLALDVEARLR